VDIVKERNKITLIIAMIIIPFGFYYGTESSVVKDLTTVSPEYQAWEKEYNERLNFLRQKKDPISFFFSFFSDDPIMDDPVIKELLTKKPAQYRSFPSVEYLIAGTFSASASFLIVLFGLRGIIRLFAWVAKE